MNDEKTKWWSDNLSNIERLNISIKDKLEMFLDIFGIDKAEEFLWEEILNLENLKMSRGIGKLIYCDLERPCPDEDY